MHGLKFTALFIMLLQAREPITNKDDGGSDGLFWVIVLLAFFIGVTAGILITQSFHLIKKSFSNSETKNVSQQAPAKKPHVSLCPVCHTSYTDPTLRYCLSDGSILFTRPPDENKYDPEVTLISSK